MSEESKYYTPAKEDFHIGFEYQWRVDDDLNKWSDGVIRDGSQIDDIYKTYMDEPIYALRVKTIDHSDIEAEGWKKIKEDVFCVKNLQGMELVLALTIGRRNWIIVEKFHYDKGEDTSYRQFVGTIRNRSELRILMRQLGIQSSSKQ